MIQKYLAFFSQINNRLIEILPYTDVINHTNFWKLELTNVQRETLVIEWATQDVFLKLAELQALDSYFNIGVKEVNFDLSPHGETMFDYTIYVNKPIEE